MIWLRKIFWMCHVYEHRGATDRICAVAQYNDLSVMANCGYILILRYFVLRDLLFYRFEEKHKTCSFSFHVVPTSIKCELRDRFLKTSG